MCAFIPCLPIEAFGECGRNDAMLGCRDGLLKKSKVKCVRVKKVPNFLTFLLTFVTLDVHHRATICYHAARKHSSIEDSVC